MAAVVQQDRFEDAVARLSEKRWWGQSLYDLPWYMIIGAPGSSRTRPPCSRSRPTGIHCGPQLGSRRSPVQPLLNSLYISLQPTS